MALHVHRHPRIEALVDGLHAYLAKDAPADPFAPMPVVVGSRGMSRWLRHELASRSRSAAGLEFLFPKHAFDLTAAWLLDGDPDASFEAAYRHAQTDDGWTGPRFLARVLIALRRHLDEPRFDRIRGYVEGRASTDRRFVREETAIGRKEVSFAMALASTLERLHYDRPQLVLDWLRSPDAAGDEHRWLADLLGSLELDDAEAGASMSPSSPAPVGPSPAARFEALRSANRDPRDHALHVFGLSTMRPGDRVRFELLARHIDLHIHTLIPSRVFWGDVLDRNERRLALRQTMARKRLTPEDREAVNTLLEQNALLSSNGRPSRDFQAWLEELDEQYVDCPVDERSLEWEEGRETTLLDQLQAWLDGAESNPKVDEAPWRKFAGCSSVEIHACHGALRQCEALRDELLRRFALDRTLEARHVLVMTPDVATYAPLVAAVFGRHATVPTHALGRPEGSETDAPRSEHEESLEMPAIPVQIADLGLRSTNTVAEALLGVLELTEARVTASALVALLGLWPVRERFDMTEDELPALRELIVGSGLRWAWDASDRLEHDQPAVIQNTVEFALERLALGVLMPDDDPLEHLPASGGRPVAVPLDVATRERTELVGKFANFCRAVKEQRDRVRTPATAAEWHLRLRSLLDAMTRVGDATAWLRAQVNDALDEQLPPTLSDELKLDVAGLTALLRGAFELPSKGERAVTSAVTVCAMEPMRSVPFRVIAIVGLDDGAFPRTTHEPSWSPFAKLERGEHDRRMLDRHLFLESLLCAREALLLFGAGFEGKRGTPTPMAIVTSELAELVEAGVGLRPKQSLALDWPVRSHPLQPWSTAAFEQKGLERDRLPFDPSAFAARAALDDATHRARHGAAPRLSGLAAMPADAPWPKENAPPTRLDAASLAHALDNAPRELIKRRLGLDLERRDDTLPDREPTELDNLAQWKVRDRLLRELLSEREIEIAAAHATPPSEELAGTSAGRPSTRVSKLKRRLQAEGTLPLHARAELLLEMTEKEAAQTVARAAMAGTPLGAPLEASVTVHGLTISTHVQDVRTADGPHLDSARWLVWVTASSEPTNKLILQAWVSLLVARAAGESVCGATVVGGNGKKVVSLEGPNVMHAEAARDALKGLVDVYLEARRTPLPLFPKVSRKIAQLRQSEPDAPAEELLDRCAAEWEGGFQMAGERDDPWVAAVYPDLSLEQLPAERVVELACAVWGEVAAELPTKGRKKKEERDGADDGTSTEQGA